MVDKSQQSDRLARERERKRRKRASETPEERDKRRLADKMRKAAK